MAYYPDDYEHLQYGYKIVVECGNGGEYEYHLNKYLWEEFIKIKLCAREFYVLPHKDADKAVVHFKHEKDAALFSLTKPVYVGAVSG